MSARAVARSWLSKWSSFIEDDIWRLDVQKLSPSRSLAIRLLRILITATRGFDRDKCQLRASALTFYSLLSVVPVLAMAFGIAKGFGLEQNLEQVVAMRLRGQDEVRQWMMQFTHSFLANTQGGLVAGIGLVTLFWSVISVLGYIESAFNDIWGVTKSRSLTRKFSDYLSMMLICPVLLVVSSSVTAYVTNELQDIAQHHAMVGHLHPLVWLFLNVLPYAVVWLLFSFIYILMPNTKVSIRSGLLSGIIAGTLYQFVQWAYLTFQIGVAKYNAVYGSFAALPLFLAWLQVSWLVVLFGAEISFAMDNENTSHFERESISVSERLRHLMALRLTEICVKRFEAGEPAASLQQLGDQLGAPLRLVRDVLHELVEAGVLIEIKQSDQAPSCYQPARTPAKLTIKTVLSALEERGQRTVPLLKEQELRKLADALRAIDQLVEHSPQNLPLTSL